MDNLEKIAEIFIKTGKEGELILESLAQSGFQIIKKFSAGEYILYFIMKKTQ